MYTNALSALQDFLNAANFCNDPRGATDRQRQEWREMAHFHSPRAAQSSKVYFSLNFKSVLLQIYSLSCHYSSIRIN